MHFAGLCRNSISKYFFIVIVLYPLPYITQHIVYPPGIGLLLTYPMGSTGAYLCSPSNLSPRYIPCCSGTGCILPLKLRRQAVCSSLFHTIQLVYKLLCILP